MGKQVLVELSHRDDAAGYWLIVTVDRADRHELGPFGTPAARQAAHDDMMAMTRSLGAVDLPLQPQ